MCSRLKKNPSRFWNSSDDIALRRVREGSLRVGKMAVGEVPATPVRDEFKANKNKTAIVGHGPSTQEHAALKGEVECVRPTDL